MDTDIYALVGKYGFKNLHTRLSEIMREEYQYLQAHFQVVADIAVVSPPPAPVVPVVAKKVRKQKVKFAANTQIPEAVNNESEVLAQPEVSEIKDIIVTAPSDRGFRDPKEMKAYQKEAEEVKRKENEAAGVQLFQILTKDNLKQWVEVEGRTYAWVAREKAGCAETQVAATAQMMGIKSTISKKRGIIMAGK